MNNAFQHMLSIIALLEDNGVYYRLNKFSTENDRIVIEAAFPGERWEIEIDRESNVYIEKFISDGTTYPEDELTKILDRTDGP